MYSNLLLFLNKIKHCKEYVYQHAELFRFSQSVHASLLSISPNQSNNHAHFTIIFEVVSGIHRQDWKSRLKPICRKGESNLQEDFQKVVSSTQIRTFFLL